MIPTNISQSANSGLTQKLTPSQQTAESSSKFKKGICNSAISLPIWNQLKEHRQFIGLKEMTRSEWQTYQIHFHAARTKGTGASFVAAINNRRRDCEGTLHHKSPNHFRKDSENLVKKGYLHAEAARKFHHQGGGSAPTIYIPKNKYLETLEWDVEAVKKHCLIVSFIKKKRGRPPSKRPVGRPPKKTELNQKSSTVATPKKLSTRALNSDTISLRSKEEHLVQIFPRQEAMPIESSKLSLNALLQIGISVPKSRTLQKNLRKEFQMPAIKPSVRDDYSDYNPFACDTSDYEDKMGTAEDDDKSDKRVDRFAEKETYLGVDPCQPIAATWNLENLPGIDCLQIPPETLMHLRYKFQNFKFSKEHIQINAKVAIYKVKTGQYDPSKVNMIGILSNCIRYDYAKYLWEIHRDERARRKKVWDESCERYEDAPEITDLID